jgi:hypothetical protein
MKTGSVAATSSDPAGSRSMRALQKVARAVAWGTLMAASAIIAQTYGYGRDLSAQVVIVAAIYWIGGVLAVVVSWPAVKWARGIEYRIARTALICVFLASATLAVTAGVVALQYRLYYAQWHEAAFSRVWLWQQFFTALGSTFQFAVIGTRFYWPVGAACLIPFCWWLSRKTR